MRLRLVLALAVALLGAERTHARPLYFDNFVALYGFSPGDDLYACGVCHRNWEGTGARNPYGFAVEQQLYIGQSITNAILAVEATDTDLDGFPNLDELTTHGTLPGYSCDNFDLVLDPPPNFQSLITPGVPSCLEPKDLRVDPLTVAFVTETGEQTSFDVEIVNNGTDDPIAVSAVGFLPGVDASLSLSGPAAPFAIPVGGKETFTVTFAPIISMPVAATLRVTSDDPDQPVIDVSISALAVTLPLASAEDRSACLKVVDRQTQAYAKRSLQEWERCYLDEVRGRACDAGRRTQKLQQTASTLREKVGGLRDVACAGNGLSPVFLGLPNTCGGACSHIAVNNIPALADCLVCRTDEATATALDSAFGVVPPDLPATAANPQAASCQKKVIKAMRKAASGVQRTLARCELDNITAAVPVDCAASAAATLANLQAKVDATPGKCSDTTGLLGCPFEMAPIPTCLGDTAAQIGSDLVEATFGPAD